MTPIILPCIPTSVRGTLRLNIPIVLLTGNTVEEVVRKRESSWTPGVFYAIKNCGIYFYEIEAEIRRIVLSSLEEEYPPAGYARGLLRVDLQLPVSMRWTPADMDELYQRGVNPIKSTARGEHYVWGQKFVGSDEASYYMTQGLHPFGLYRNFLPYLDVEGSGSEYSISALKTRFEYRVADSEYLQEARSIMNGIKSEYKSNIERGGFDGVRKVELYHAYQFMTTLFNQLGVNHE